MRRRKRRKQKHYFGTVVGVLLLVIILGAGGFAAFKLLENDSSKKASSAKESTAPTAEKTESKTPETATPQQSKPEATTSESTETEDTETVKDVRAVKNTATKKHHKTNGLAICMYHYIYDKNNPPKDPINNNYIELSALKKELQYLVDNNYYFPTWEEVRKYVDGDLLLPEKSVVLTFDDGAMTFLNYASVFDEYKVPVTSFLIGSKRGKKKVKKYASDYLTFQSHSYDMHHGGGNIGHGGIFPVMSYDDALKDLKKSIKICGHGEAFAYPYGDYNNGCVKAVKDAGFLCAVTTENRRAKVGDDPMLLPRVRMIEGQSLKTFISVVK